MCAHRLSIHSVEEFRFFNFGVCFVQELVISENRARNLALVQPKCVIEKINNEKCVALILINSKRLCVFFFEIKMPLRRFNS